jgi:hypothetical protein
LFSRLYLAWLRWRHRRLIGHFYVAANRARPPAGSTRPYALRTANGLRFGLRQQGDFFKSNACRKI